VFTLFVLLNNFFANFTLSCAAEALNSVSNCLFLRNGFFTVGTFDIVLALLILRGVLACTIIVVCTTTLHSNTLLLSAKNFGVAFALDIQHLYTIDRILSNATPPLWLIVLLLTERTHNLGLQLITYKCC